MRRGGAANYISTIGYGEEIPICKSQGDTAGRKIAAIAS
jgi:hypothetical protein